jgi:hypothetical protein
MQRIELTFDLRAGEVRNAALVLCLLNPRFRCVLLLAVTAFVSGGLWALFFDADLFLWRLWMMFAVLVGAGPLLIAQANAARVLAATKHIVEKWTVSETAIEIRSGKAFHRFGMDEIAGIKQTPHHIFVRLGSGLVLTVYKKHVQKTVLKPLVGMLHPRG